MFLRKKSTKSTEAAAGGHAIVPRTSYTSADDLAHGKDSVSLGALQEVATFVP